MRNCFKIFIEFFMCVLKLSLIHISSPRDPLHDVGFPLLLEKRGGGGGGGRGGGGGGGGGGG
ncbi:hypothetical protein ACQ4LK_22335, partial [Bacillus pumilus]